MAKVSIMKRVKLGSGWQFCKIVRGGNGKIKPDAIIVKGAEEIHPEGKYYIDFLLDGKRIRKPAVSAADAVIMAAKQGQELIVRKQAQRAGIELPEPEVKGERSLTEAIDAYLIEIEAGKKKKTHDSYRVALGYFLESCSKTTVERIERTDMLKYTTFLREKKLSPRTAANKFESVTFFLRWANAPLIYAVKDKKINKNDRPKFVKKDVRVYEKDEIARLLAACDERERLWFTFFLQTGMREQEVMHASWDAVNFARGTVTVRYNPAYGFSPKAYKEREIPIPDSLVESLKALKTAADTTCGLIFPNGKCEPNKYFLKYLKIVATRAGMNPNDFKLHKFRATFCTWHLWANVDLRTVQSWAGHTTIESTMRYLKPNQNEAVRDKVNATFA